MTRTVTVLGSTGSIGTQTLDVVARHPDRFRVAGLAAGGNVESLLEQIRTFRPERVAVADVEAARLVREALEAEHGAGPGDGGARAGGGGSGTGVDVLDGPDGVAELAAMPVDVVVNGIDGSRGLRPTLAALDAGSRVALANKESLVLGGPLVIAAARKPDQLVPVDSEHSALAQCLRGGRADEVARLVITASGGPFRGRTRAQLAHVTPEQALAHPTWDMGALVTVNSATLANKGLEVIEAHLLFGVPYERIDVVVHPQSIVHSMVEFLDGATVAKLSPPDMRLPIQLALGWPERLDFAPTRMDWTQAQALTFEPVDHGTFPLVGLAIAAGKAGGTAPGVCNAANEEAVAAFLDGRLPFLGIPEVVEAVLAAYDGGPASDLETVLAAERWARSEAKRVMAERGA